MVRECVPGVCGDTVATKPVLLDSLRLGAWHRIQNADIARDLEIWHSFTAKFDECDGLDPRTGLWHDNDQDLVFAQRGRHGHDRTFSDGRELCDDRLDLPG